MSSPSPIAICFCGHLGSVHTPNGKCRGRGCTCEGWYEMDDGRDEEDDSDIPGESGA